MPQIGSVTSFSIEVVYTELSGSSLGEKRPGSMSRFVFLMALGLAACRTSPVRGEPHLEIYKVQDIVRCHQTSSFSISCEIPDHPEGCGQFERKLRQATIGTPWDDETGWSLIFQNSLLIVRADESTQHLVRSFLAAERAKAPSDVK